jgi:hypothetical protein
MFSYQAIEIRKIHKSDKSNTSQSRLKFTISKDNFTSKVVKIIYGQIGK